MVNPVVTDDSYKFANSEMQSLKWLTLSSNAITVKVAITFAWK